MQLVTVEKKTNSKIDQAKVLLRIFCVLSEIKLSDTDLTVLAYFLVYKISDKTKDLIVKSQILSADSLKNTMSRFNKVGLIKKSTVSKEYHIADSLNIQMDSMIGMLIKINNT